MITALRLTHNTALQTRESGEYREALDDFQDILRKAQGARGSQGEFNVKIEYNMPGTQASGTVTCASVLAADTVTINGVVFTAVTGAAGANQFDRSGTDTATATNLAAAINASVTALIPNYVTATSAIGVVTIASISVSQQGNLNTLASSNGGRLAVSGARLTGGVVAVPVNFNFGA